MSDEIEPAFIGEVRLLRWQDNQFGRSVTFELDRELVRHPFNGLLCGNEHGQRMKLVAVLVDDNEEPMTVDAGRQRKKQKPAKVKPNQEGGEKGTAEKPREGGDGVSKRAFRELPRSQQAALKCQDAEFQEWMKGRHPFRGEARITLAEDAEGRTDRWLKGELGILSKKELDTDPAKAEAWDKLLASFDYKDRV